MRGWVLVGFLAPFPTLAAYRRRRRPLVVPARSVTGTVAWMTPRPRSPLLVPALIAATLVVHTLMLAGWSYPHVKDHGGMTTQPSSHAEAASDERGHGQHLMAVGCVALAAAAALVAPRSASSSSVQSAWRRLDSRPTAPTWPAAANCRDPVSSSVLLRI